jgi:hypothetical protein
MPRKPVQRVVLIEPYCWGFEHVPFNAALVAAALHAFPRAHVEFHAESQHLDAVRAALHGQPRELCVRARWRRVATPHRNTVGPARLPAEYRFLSTVLHHAAEKSADVVIITCISDTGLWALKRILWSRPAPFPVLAVPHSVLAALGRPRTRRPLQRALDLHAALLLPHPPRLGLVALGESILRCLHDVTPDAAPAFVTVDHPYLFPPLPETPTPGSPHPIRFGFLGVTNKGFESFVSLARSLAGDPRAEFHLAGFANCGLPKDADRWVHGIGHAPLSSPEYHRRVRALDYAVVSGRPETYRFVASGSFLDAVAWGKPVIHLQNPWILHHAGRMGDIGHACPSTDDMRALVNSLVNHFDREHHRRQVTNLLHGRALFDPAVVANQLQEAVSLVNEQAA